MIRRLSILSALLLLGSTWPGSKGPLAMVGPRVLDAQQSHVSDTSDNDDDSIEMKVYDALSGTSGSQRVITVARQARPRDSASVLRLDVTYGSGTLNIGPADRPWLFNVRLENPSSKDNRRLISFDTVARVLRVTSGNSDHISMDFDHPRHAHDPESSDLKIGLGHSVPLDISLQFGAAEANAQLGGLSVRRLDIETGASETSIGFDAPNPIPLEMLDLKVGAAAFKASGLGNANIRHMTVQAGAGGMELDFGGNWRGDMTLDLTAALGAIKIHVPPGVVIDKNLRVFLGGLDDNAAGVSPVPAAPGSHVYHLHLTGTATLGAIELDRHTSG
jgi:hypothetical protein